MIERSCLDDSRADSEIGKELSERHEHQRHSEQPEILGRQETCKHHRCCYLDSLAGDLSGASPENSSGSRYTEWLGALGIAHYWLRHWEIRLLAGRRSAEADPLAKRLFYVRSE